MPGASKPRKQSIIVGVSTRKFRAQEFDQGKSQISRKDNRVPRGMTRRKLKLFQDADWLVRQAILVRRMWLG